VKIIIAGIRTLVDYSVVCRAVEISGFSISMVVSGLDEDIEKRRVQGFRIRGVDALGERWARQNKIPFKRFSPNWERYGKRAGPKRNREMALFADGLLAIWNGQSRGTKDMIDAMFEVKKPIFIYSIPSRTMGGGREKVAPRLSR
jgi:hypothetical protein